jgi:RNA polymerase sigma-70 factor (ECF subfamily)
MFASTIVENLRDFQSFYVAYHEPVRSVLRMTLGVRHDDLDDLSQSFFLKVLEKNLLASYEGERGMFRWWLFTALKHHLIDKLRENRRSVVKMGLGIAIDPVEVSESEPEVADEADSLYALHVLNMALQKMRLHCEKSGKPEIWSIFEGWFLGMSDGRPQKQVIDEIHARFPEHDRQYVLNRMVSGQRIFRHILPGVIPPSLSECDDPEERFEEWKWLYGRCRAGLRDRVRLAFCVNPAPASGDPKAPSMNLTGHSDVLDDWTAAPLARTLGDDELRILLSFRLAMPLDYYLGPLDNLPRRPKAGASGRLDGLSKPAAPLTLQSLLTPGSEPYGLLKPAAPLTLQSLLTPGSEPLGGIEEAIRLDLFRRLKRFAKWNHENGGKAIPRGISEVIYNLAIVLALLHCRTRISELGDAALVRNLRWTLARPWIDTPLRSVFRRGLQDLERPPAP